LTIPQLADLFTVIPHDQVTGLMELLPEDKATRIRAILAEDETMAKSILSSDFLAVQGDAKVGDVLETIRLSGREPGSGTDVRQVPLSNDSRCGQPGSPAGYHSLQRHHEGCRDSCERIRRQLWLGYR